MAHTTLSVPTRPGSTPGLRTGIARRAAELGLMAALALGSLLLWIGIPGAWLWLWSQASSQYLVVLGAALVGCPLTMAAWGWCLHRINRVYLRVSETPEAPRTRPGWTRAMGVGRERARSVLETWMTISVVLAIVAFVAWCLFFGAPGNGAGPGAW